MKLLSQEEFSDIFDYLWDGLQEEFFKVETLQTYAVSPEEESYRAFLEGRYEDARRLLWQYLSTEVNEPDRKIQMKRIHILELPISQYIKYEIESYRISQGLGEQIFLVRLEDVEDDYRRVHIPMQDFIMFDKKTTIVHNFDHNGSLLSSQLLENSTETQIYLDIRSILLNKALPLEAFLSEFHIDRC